jgi:hypothetical protein
MPPATTHGRRERFPGGQNERTSAVSARTAGELLREFFGTLRADFGILCPVRSHLRDSLRKLRAKKQSIYGGLLARPKRFELLTPRFVVWCSPI